MNFVIEHMLHNNITLQSIYVIESIFLLFSKTKIIQNSMILVLDIYILWNHWCICTHKGHGPLPWFWECIPPISLNFWLLNFKIMKCSKTPTLWIKTFGNYLGVELHIKGFPSCTKNIIRDPMVWEISKWKTNKTFETFLLGLNRRRL